MKRIAVATATILLTLTLVASAGAKGAAPQPHPFAFYTTASGLPALVSPYLDGAQIVNGGSGTTPNVPLGAPVSIGQGGGCQEQCAVQWFIDGVLAHTGSVAVAGFGDLGFTTTFTTPGSHVVLEVLSISHKGVVSSLSAQLVLPVG
jgi:hypothetical protein